MLEVDQRLKRLRLEPSFQ